MYKVNHGWLYGAVKPHFESKGYKLLRDDMMFIEKCLSNIPTDKHRQVMRDYFVLWDTTIARSQNADCTPLNARYEANVYLRTCCFAYE